jgi:ribosomal protein S18 acetylase RimI-like enzyme
MGAIELVPMREATPEARADVARVMRECEAYYRAVQGRPADDHEVDDFFRFEVPGVPPENARAFGVRVDGAVVGLASLLLGWKRPGQSMIGFLAISDRHRGHGYARAAYDALEAVARASPHGQSLRIGIVETNAQAFGFWHHLGFVETGERRQLDDFVADVILLEKALDA